MANSSPAPKRSPASCVRLTRVLWTLRTAVRILMRMRTGSPSQSSACAGRAGGELEAGCRLAGSELAGTMLSPEAERVLQYLVEVEELAEAVLADKRQVGGSSAALGPGFGDWGLVASAVGKRSGYGIWLQH